MSQYLDLDDVVITEKKTSVVKSEPSKPISTQHVKKKDKRPKIVISDDDEFESKTIKKQSKLNFGSKPKESLFSCLTSGKSQKSILQVPDLVAKTCDTEDILQADSEENFRSNSPKKEQVEVDLPDITDIPVNIPDVVDVQHDVSFEDFISQRNDDFPTNENCAEVTSLNDDEEHELNEIVQSPRYLTQVDDLKDLNENELSVSLFEAINETWDFELSQKGPDLIEVPAPPSQVPSLELSDFSLFSSQQHPVPTSSKDDSVLERCQVPLCPKPGVSELSSDSDKFSDDIEDTLIENSCSELNPQNEALFESLAKMEKQQSVADDDLDLMDETPDITFSDVLTQSDRPRAEEGNVLKDDGKLDVQPPCVGVSTPAHNRQFQPLESSTPALVKSYAPLCEERTRHTGFVTPHVKHCLKRVKKKPDLLEKNSLPQLSTMPSANNTTNEESPLNVGKRKRRCNILCSQIPTNSDDLDISNDKKKSRLFSPDKPVIVKSNLEKENKPKPNQFKTKGGAAANPFIIAEADLSGDDDFDEGSDEDLMSSSLEDFIDQEEQPTGIWYKS